MKIVDAFAAAFYQLCLDLQFKNGTTPTIFYRFCAYQRRLTGSLSLSNNSRFVLHGICATTRCTISSSGQHSANFRIYLMFLGEKPDISGKASFKSFAIRSMTFAPQPSSSCFLLLPFQYSNKDRSYLNWRLIQLSIVAAGFRS